VNSTLSRRDTYDSLSHIPGLVFRPYNFAKFAHPKFKKGVRQVGFFANLFQYPFNEPWVQEINQKIDEAKTDEEREMYENELNYLLMTHYRLY
jgi:hypothetical protein